MAKWLERLTAEQNTDGSSRTLGSQLGCSPTVHLAANGYLVATLGKLNAARKGTGHPTSLYRRLRISVPLMGTPPTYGIVHGNHLYLKLLKENSPKEPFNLNDTKQSRIRELVPSICSQTLVDCLLCLC